MKGRTYQFADLFSSHGDGSPVNLRDPRDPAYKPDKADAIGALTAAVKGRTFQKSKAALDDYDARNLRAVGTHQWIGGGENSAYAQAVLGVGDNAHGSTNVADYDENGALNTLIRRLGGN